MSDQLLIEIFPPEWSIPPEEAAGGGRMVRDGEHPVGRLVPLPEGWGLLLTDGPAARQFAEHVTSTSSPSGWTVLSDDAEIEKGKGLKEAAAALGLAAALASTDCASFRFGPPLPTIGGISATDRARGLSPEVEPGRPVGPADLPIPSSGQASSFAEIDSSLLEPTLRSGEGVFLVTRPANYDVPSKLVNLVSTATSSPAETAALAYHSILRAWQVRDSVSIGHFPLPVPSAFPGPTYVRHALEAVRDGKPVPRTSDDSLGLVQEYLLGLAAVRDRDLNAASVHFRKCVSPAILDNQWLSVSFPQLRASAQLAVALTRVKHIEAGDEDDWRKAWRNALRSAEHLALIDAETRIRLTIASELWLSPSAQRVIGVIEDDPPSRRAFFAALRIVQIYSAPGQAPEDAEVASLLRFLKL